MYYVYFTTKSILYTHIYKPHTYTDINTLYIYLVNSFSSINCRNKKLKAVVYLEKVVHFILIKCSIHQEDMSLNLCVPYNLKTYEINTELHGEADKTTILAGNLIHLPE